ncbi:GNAT family N-acetyltransferase [Salinibaculum rarum]|uniref:GNAT family N-acetyltransferase n=1 Tax=Salinibaculum rarum TaxID=3058903 RepID=UPI0026605AAC|nr:GNAT family N-acetyltransferase [Salinibaculum sp. KK48]
MTTIRRYQPRDADIVRRLNDEVLRTAGTDPADIPHPDDIEDVQGAYLDTGGEFLVAERDGVVVGMGGLRVDGTEGELFRMRVALDCQREGVGADLLAALEDAARERDVEVLRAQTAQRQSAAVSFYPKNGYERVGTSTRGEDYTLVHFRKEL